MGLFRRVRKIAKSDKRQLASTCLPVRSSVSTEQLGSLWTDFQEILYLIMFRKFVKKIQVSLELGNNNGYCT